MIRDCCSRFGIRLAIAVTCMLLPGEVSAQSDKHTLKQLNYELFESVILRGDTTQWSAVALEVLLVIPPGGVLENRAQAFAGVGAFDGVQALTVVTDSVAIHDDTAVLVGRLRLDREVRPVGRVGPLRFMNVFVRTDDGWKLLARSLTPCSERAVEAGRLEPATDGVGFEPTIRFHVHTLSRPKIRVV